MMRRLRSLVRATDGVSAVEFAFGLPIVLAVGCYGVETANLALTHLRVSQYALYLADNASRVGDTTLATTQVREADINDIFQGLRLQSQNLKLTTYGRVTLSSLERQSDGKQLIHWQRCVGANNKAGYGSNYGVTGDTSLTLTMGDSWGAVSAPSGYGVMFVEINYDYRPIFGTIYASAQKIHYTASYLVRDSRDYTQITNPSPVQTASSCSAYTT